MNTLPPSRPVPLRALVLSLGSFSIPVAWALLFPERAAEESGMLVWLTALVPAFLLTYYRGWEGASLALAAGMAILSATQVILLVAGISSPDWALLLAVVLVYICISFGIGILAELLHRERRAAQQLALTDLLTGLPNRRHANVFLEASFAAAQRGTPVSVVLFDVDEFKSFNDRFGHSAGDEVLRLLGRVLEENTRQMNISARWGGEEFLSVLSGTDAEGAAVFAERVREALTGAGTRWGRVTVSAGVAAFAPGMESPDLLLAAADRALYAAKEGGRDRVRRAGELGGERGATTPYQRAMAADGSAGARTDSAPARRDAEAPTPPDTSRRRPTMSTRPETILVVEDDEDARRAVARSLQFHGYAVLDAASGEEALTILRQGERAIDLLVTDIMLPGMSGFTLVDRILRYQTRLGVLYMSGYSHDDVSWDGVPGSRSAFLKKPMDVEELGARVRALLDAEQRPEGGAAVDGEEARKPV